MLRRVHERRMKPNRTVDLQYLRKFSNRVLDEGQRNFRDTDSTLRADGKNAVAEKMGEEERK